MKKEEAPKFKRIDFKSGKFIANGKTYYIQDKLSIARHIQYEHQAPQVMYGMSTTRTQQSFTEIYNALGTGNSVMGSVQKAMEICINQLFALKSYDERPVPLVYRFCALFVNRADEDVTKWDENIAMDKINDWTKEGLVREDFFFLCMNAIAGFESNYRALWENPNVNKIDSESKE